MRCAKPVSLVLFLFSLMLTGSTLQAGPYVTVTDDGILFSPDTVNIVTGMSVEWLDDGTGPYFITVSSGGFAIAYGYTPAAYQFTQAGTYQIEDDAGDQGTVNVSANSPPSVSIVSPTNNAIFIGPASFTFSADASDSDADGLSDVELYVGSNVVDDVFSPGPFETTITNLAAGTYTLTAVAYDYGGAETTNSVSIQVGNSGPLTLTAPAVTADEFEFAASGLTAGKTNILEGATDLVSAVWAPISTNVATGASVEFTNAIGGRHHFFRLVQLP